MGSVPPPIGGDNHAHRHDHDDGGLADIELRVRALESLMVEKGYVDPAALDALIETYETGSGRATAPAWSRAPGAIRTIAAACCKDATSAIARLGYAGRQGEHMVGAREHGRAPQSGRLHFLLVLSLAGARPAAGLVQVAALSLARGDRSARRAGRIRRRPAGADKNPRLGSTARSATSSFPSDRRAPKDGARNGSPRSSAATA